MSQAWRITPAGRKSPHITFQKLVNIKVEVWDSYHVLYVCVANGMLNINIISVNSSDAPISSISRLNMADLEVLITVIIP
jgi:hypothetical protein